MQISPIPGLPRPLHDAPSEGGGANPPAGAWTPPEGLAPEYVGKDAAETLGKLLPAFTDQGKRVDDMRTKLAQLPRAPDKPEHYTFTPAEKLKPWFPDPANHKGLNHARAVFHKHGIPDAAFGGIINDLYGAMAESGDLAAPYDPKVELDTFAKAHNLDGTGTQARLKAAETFAGGLFEQMKGQIPEPLQKSAQAELAIFMETAGGVALLEALSKRLAEGGNIRVAGEGGAQGGPLSAAELKAMSTDPRIDPANRHHPDAAKRYDEALRRRYDEGYAALAKPG